MSSEENKSPYQPVDIASLREGMLLDRPLYLHFSKSGRYVRFLNELQPLEKGRLEKLQKVGQVFSSVDAIEKEFPDLNKSAADVRQVCDEAGLASFEKMKSIFNLTDWLVSYVLGERRMQDFRPALFFFHRAFGVPKPETLFHVSDVSVEMFEKTLKLATLSGVVALWLGYNDTKFLTQFVETVFCEEIALYKWKQEGKLPDVGIRTDKKYLENYQTVLSDINSGKVPGIKHHDHRFSSYLLTNYLNGGSDDELYQIVEFVRGWHKLTSIQNEWFALGRVSKKLTRIFNIQFQLEFEELPSDFAEEKAA